MNLRAVMEEITKSGGQRPAQVLKPIIQNHGRVPVYMGTPFCCQREEKDPANYCKDCDSRLGCSKVSLVAHLVSLAAELRRIPIEVADKIVI